MVMMVVVAGGGRPQLVKSLLAGTLGLEESENTRRIEKAFLVFYLHLHFILIILSRL